MKENQHIKHEIKNNISIITLDNPRVYNAFDDKLIEGLTNLIEFIEKQKNIKLLILNATGPHFSAGANLKWMHSMIHFSAEENKNDALKLAALLHKLNHFSKPTIALVQGKTLGGGIGLIACCDIVIAHADASFCFPEVTLGLIPATIAPYVIRNIGYSAAKFYFISANTMNAQQALHLGLIHQVTATKELLIEGFSFAQQLLKNGPKAMTAIKNLTNHIVPINDKLILETAELLAAVRISDEGQEGLKAFLEKRKPIWEENK